MEIRISLVFTIGILARLIISFWNGFYGPSIGAEADSLTFHFNAIEYAKNLRITDFLIGTIYSYLLGIFYYLTFPSLFLGGVLSVISWLLATFVLIRTLDLCLVSKNGKFLAILIYSLLPSSIFMTSIPLRESFQMLFLNFAIFYAIKISITSLRKSKFVYWILLVTSVFCMSILHGALIAIGIIVAVGTFFGSMSRGTKKKTLMLKVLIIVGLCFVLYLGFLIFSAYSYNIDAGLGVAIDTYQENLINTDARTTYRNINQIGDISNNYIYVIPVFFQYFFEPLPWRISTSMDFILLLENVLRVMLIWMAFTNAKRNHGEHRKIIMLILFIFIFSEAVWSVGTANWGTAVRHHLPASGMLLVAAFAFTKKININNLKNAL